jgi:hypothetical protein
MLRELVDAALALEGLKASGRIVVGRGQLRGLGVDLATDVTQ